MIISPIIPIQVGVMSKDFLQTILSLALPLGKMCRQISNGTIKAFHLNSVFNYIAWIHSRLANKVSPRTLRDLRTTNRISSGST